MPWKHNTLLVLFSDLTVSIHDQIFRFLYSGARKASFRHIGDIQGQAHVALFPLYLTSMPCHSSRQGENLQENSCCFKQWVWAITSTRYTSVASSKVSKARFFHPRGCLSGNSSTIIRELATSWCSHSRTVRTNPFVDHGGFLLRVAINQLRSSRWTLTVHYTVLWWPFTLIWIYSHPTAYCFLYVLLPVLHTIFKCASSVICLVAALAASQWTNWCLCCCCVPRTPKFDVPPTNRLDLDLLTPCRGGCVCVICWCVIGEEDENQMKWEALRTI